MFSVNFTKQSIKVCCTSIFYFIFYLGIPRNKYLVILATWNWSCKFYPCFWHVWLHSSDYEPSMICGRCLHLEKVLEPVGYIAFVVCIHIRVTPFWLFLFVLGVPSKISLKWHKKDRFKVRDGSVPFYWVRRPFLLGTELPKAKKYIFGHNLVIFGRTAYFQCL